MRAETAPTPATKPSPVAGAKILMVDDHPENLLALESVLDGMGLELVKANTGRDALKEVLREDFAAILMDVQMPGMDGFETATMIRARGRSQNTPIIFLTAVNKDDIHVSTGYSVGAVDYVFKPFHPEILKAKVLAFVEMYRKNRELEEEVSRRTAAEQEVLRLNRELEARVRERTAELEATNRKLKTEIAERRQAESEIIRHQQSIEALNQRLRRAMTETHHRVKNSLQVIAAMVDMHVTGGKPSVSAAEVKTISLHIQTLAAIHDLLTQEAKEDGQANHILARTVLLKLIEMLETTSASRPIKYELDDARLTTRQGTSLGLIVNELISNAVKYGAGDILVKFIVDGPNAVLYVIDDGPGFPDGFDPAKAANTGLELVNNLTEWDLGGTAEFRNAEGGGASVGIRLPLVEC